MSLSRPFLLLEMGLSLLVVMTAFMAGRWLKSPSFSGERFFTQVFPRVALLLIPAVLLLQPEVPFTPIPLAIALFLAGLTTLGAHLVIVPILRLYRWFDEIGVDAGMIDENLSTVPVKHMMRNEWLSIPADMPVLQLARLFFDHSTSYGLVTDTNGRLVGIVTKAELFIKQERLPRIERTYTALFKHPILPVKLTEVYAKLAEHHRVSDIMIVAIICVREDQSVGSAAREMAQHGVEYLPVMRQSPDANDKVVGIITRSSIIYWLMNVGHDAYPV